MVGLLLSVTFTCGLVIAGAHVLNRHFVAPAYDAVLNLTAFGCAVAASLLLGHWTPALLSTGAIACWLMLARRTILAHRQRGERSPQAGPRPEAARSSRMTSRCRSATRR